MSLISNSWQIHVCTLFFDFNSLELSIVEVRCVLDIFKLGWLDIVLKSAEVLLGKLLLGVGLETLVERWDLALVVLGVDG